MKYTVKVKTNAKENAVEEGPDGELRIRVNLTSTNIVDFEGIYFRNPLVSLHVDSQKCFVVTE